MKPFHVWYQAYMRNYGATGLATGEALAEQAWLAAENAVGQERDEYREALQLVAAPKRADGTYNRCREACEELARTALEKWGPK